MLREGEVAPFLSTVGGGGSTAWAGVPPGADTAPRPPRPPAAQFKIEPFKHPLKLDPNYAGENGSGPDAGRLARPT